MQSRRVPHASPKTSIALVALLAFSPLSWGWGHTGHVEISQLAIQALPPEVPEFLRNGIAMWAIGELGAEADESNTTGTVTSTANSRITTAPSVHDAERDPGHFINVDDAGFVIGGSVALNALPGTRQAFDTAQRAAVQPTGQTQYGGYLPYAIIDGFQQYGLAAKGFWNDERESNFLDGAAHFYGAYECSDGHFVSIGAIEPQFYRLLLQICGLTDPQFERQWNAAEWPSLKAKLVAMFKSRRRSEWMELLERTDCCFAPVLSMAEAPHHPHNVARKTFDVSGALTQPSPAPRFGRTPSELPKAAPLIGSDGAALLREIGYGSAQIEELIRKRELFCGSAA